LCLVARARVSYDEPRCANVNMISKLHGIWLFGAQKKRSECCIKVNSCNVDFEDERYLALAGHGDGFYITTLENLRYFLQNVSLVGCILRIISTACYNMYKKTKLCVCVCVCIYITWFSCTYMYIYIYIHIHCTYIYYL
jgi:hypothetical protein